MPENILQPMNKLLAQCNEAAVIHAIHASTGSQSRSFLYIAKCARNYIPPAPEADARSDYRVDLPPAPPPMAPALRPSPAVLPADPWAICLSELRRAYAGSDWIAMLDGSVLELAADGALDARGQPVPRYIVRVAGGVDVQRLANRAMRQIRFSLGTILGRTFMIEIVAAAAEKKPA